MTRVHERHVISTWRFTVIKSIFILLTIAIVSRLFSLQIMKHKEYSAIAERQQGTVMTAPQKRGAIFFQDKNALLQSAALNKEWPALAVSPKNVTNKERVSEILRSIAGLSEASIQRIFKNPNDPFEAALRKVPDETIEKITAIVSQEKLEGVIIAPEQRRYYPGGTLGSAVLGFVNFENDVEHGQYGIERWYDDALSGVVPFSRLEIARAKWLSRSEGRSSTPAKKGIQ